MARRPARRTNAPAAGAAEPFCLDQAVDRFACRWQAWRRLNDPETQPPLLPEGVPVGMLAGFVKKTMVRFRDVFDDWAAEAHKRAPAPPPGSPPDLAAPLTLLRAALPGQSARRAARPEEDMMDTRKMPSGKEWSGIVRVDLERDTLENINRDWEPINGEVEDAIVAGDLPGGERQIETEARLARTARRLTLNANEAVAPVQAALNGMQRKRAKSNSNLPMGREAQHDRKEERRQCIRRYADSMGDRKVSAQWRRWTNLETVERGDIARHLLRSLLAKVASIAKGQRTKSSRDLMALLKREEDYDVVEAVFLRDLPAILDARPDELVESNAELATEFRRARQRISEALRTAKRRGRPPSQ